MNLTSKLQSLGLLTDFIEACDPEVSNPDMVKWLYRRGITAGDSTVRDIRIKLDRRSDPMKTRVITHGRQRALPAAELPERKNLLHGPSVQTLRKTVARVDDVSKPIGVRYSGRSIRCLGVMDEETFNEL